MCVCFCLGACAYSYSRVCVRVGWCEGKNPSLWFTHHSVWPAEILSFSGRIAFFFFFFCPWRFFFLRQGKPNGSHSHARFLLERKSEWLMLFFRKQHQRKTHEVKMSPTILFFFFFLRCELVLKIAHIHFGFRVKHCELWQNGGRKCWGQILACCRKKIYIIQHPEVFPQHQTAWVIYTYCTAAGVPWQSLSTCRHRNEIQDVSPSTMNPS